ncbi:S8 family peptidase [Schaalia suimastitidis]|uniref:S8 family peptidase n=1 Tax=Schaalia suimastitidis TaxID=121163 RepID=UPI0003F9222A|nr:S8/S53 family peptidase [Schaalia suimastitidis]
MTCIMLSAGVSAYAQGYVHEGYIDTQSYVSAYAIDQLRAKGYDGQGVTIGVIDGPVDVTAPELQGADIEVKYMCDEEDTNNASELAHGTAIASILVAKDWGWVPQAKIINYALPDGEPSVSSGFRKPPTSCRGIHPVAYAIHQALNDGVDIISMSLGESLTEFDEAAIARAAAVDVPVIASMGNDSRENPDASYARLSTVVGVGSINAEGYLSSFSNYGDGLTVLAFGEGITLRSFDDSGYSTPSPGKQGTSYSAPMVTGAMAAAKSKWPDATGRQLIYSLMRTAISDSDGWTPQLGYGGMSVEGLLNTDPTTMPDTTPLLGRNGLSIELTQADIDDYEDGLTSPYYLEGDTTYIYRGTDELIIALYPEISQPGTSPRYANSQATSDTDAGVPVWVWVLVGLGTVITLAIVVRFFSRNKGAGRQTLPVPASPYAHIPPSQASTIPPLHAPQASPYPPSTPSPTGSASPTWPPPSAHPDQQTPPA